MLRDDFVAMLKKRLKNNNDATLDADIVSEMVFVQAHILEGDATITPWFLLSEEVETETIPDEHRLVLPDEPEFLMEWEEGCLWIYDPTAEIGSRYKPLPKADFDDLRARYPGTGPLPKGYAFSGNYFWVVPRTTAAVKLRMFYYGRAESLAAANIENKWLKHATDWFMGEVGQIIARQYIMDLDAAAAFEKQADTGKRRLMIKDQAMKEVNTSRIMGQLELSGA